MNLRIDLAYDGAPFRGFARQPEGRTIQGELELVLARVFDSPVETVVAGRTDAGVHALGQVVSTQDAPDDCDPERVRAALNAMCGPSIAATDCVVVPEDFHARFSALSRTYVYSVLTGETPDPFLARLALHHGSALDLDAMNEAAGHLAGVHDFRSFGRLPSPDSSGERILYELNCTRSGRVVRIRARANAFLQQMARSLAGTLIEIGDGRRSPDDVPAVVAARDRAAAGVVAPPHGLCLVAVEYDAGWSRPFDPYK